MRLAEAHTVASDMQPYIHQRSSDGSALSPVLVLLPPIRAIRFHVLVLFPLVAVVLPFPCAILLPALVVPPHAYVPDVPLQALGARLRSRLRSDEPLYWDENAKNSDRVETQVTAMRSAGDLISA